MAETDSTHCCALYQLYYVDNNTKINTIKYYIADDISWEQDANGNEYEQDIINHFCITKPNETKLAKRLQKCGFKKITTFLSCDGKRTLTMWLRKATRKKTYV